MPRSLPRGKRAFVTLSTLRTQGLVLKQRALNCCNSQRSESDNDSGETIHSPYGSRVASMVVAQWLHGFKLLAVPAEALSPRNQGSGSKLPCHWLRRREGSCGQPCPPSIAPGPCQRQTRTLANCQRSCSNGTNTP